MTKYGAIDAFWNSFGIPAYMDGNVPEKAVLPYITYTWNDGDIYSGETNSTVQLHYYGDSEAQPNAKLTEISNTFGLGGIRLSYTGGGIWLKKGTPWAQPLTDPDDKRYKRRILNISIEVI